MPYPICSVVAVFKMLIRIWDRALFLFFCVLAPHGMNEIAFGERRGGREQKTTVFIAVISLQDKSFYKMKYHNR